MTDDSDRDGPPPTVDLRRADRARAAGTLDLPGSDQVASAAADAPGEMIGRFVITGKLGEGGMGVVFAARDPSLGRPVAIKVMHEDLRYGERMLREARTMALVDHPNVVRIYEVGTDRDRVFVAMELVEGTTLARWLRERQHTWRDIVAMFEQAGTGLAAVHRTGLVHRDFKPENVLVDHHGRARVGDFGLARLEDDTPHAAALRDQIASLTRTGMALGTPGYMAPEQLAGDKVDARADQYAFCVALRAALEPTAGVPPSVRAALTRGAADEAAARFATIDELLAALRMLHRPRWPTRIAFATLTCAAAAIAIVAATSGSGTHMPRSNDVAGGSARDVASAGSSGGSARDVANGDPGGGSARDVANAGTASAGGGSARDVANAGSSGGSATTRTPAHAVTPGKTVAVANAANAGSAAGSPPLTARERALLAQETAEDQLAASDQHFTAGPTTTAAAHPTPFKDSAQLLLPPVSFTSKTARTIPRYDTPAADRNAVHTAIAKLGRTGLQITEPITDADVAMLRTALDDAKDDFERARMSWALGVSERARDEVAAARKDFERAAGLIQRGAGGADHAKLGAALANRISFNLVLCDLAEGHSIDAALALDSRRPHFETRAEINEVELAIAIAWWESGLASGKNFAGLVAHNSDALRPIAMTYARAVGMIPK